MSYTPTEWKNGDTITASAMNKIEQGIASAGDSYDYIVEKIGDNATPVLTKGDFQTIYNKITNQEPVMGLYKGSTDVGTYNDVVVWEVPIVRTQYYSSANIIFCSSIATDNSDSLKKLFIEIAEDGIYVTFANI